MRSTVERYKTDDDVFGDDFLAGLILSGAKDGEIEVTSDARDYLSKHGNRWLKFSPASNLLPGPYIHIDGRLRDAWLLKDDIGGTLMASLRPQDSYAPSLFR